MENEYIDKLKEYIGKLIEKYYSIYEFMRDQPLEEWQNKYIDKYLNTTSSPEDIYKSISQDLELKRQAFEYRKMHLDDLKTKDKEVVNTPQIISSQIINMDETIQLKLQEELPKIKEEEVVKEIVKTNNKGFAVLLTVVISILVVIAMILVTMISYTIIK